MRRRVFTGWNLRKSEAFTNNDPNAYQAFVFSSDDHDSGAKTFSFPIYSNGSRTIPERGASAGMQDGIDLIAALATHPETARRLARKFWNFFVSDVHEPDPQFVDAVANVYLQGNTELRPVVRNILASPWFRDPAVRFARYSWPPEFLVRAIKEVGWQGFSLDEAKAPLSNMGMQLFEPPNVGGWPVGGGWFSTATMLGAATSARRRSRRSRSLRLRCGEGKPRGLRTAMLDRISRAPLDPIRSKHWVLPRRRRSVVGSQEQLETRAAGLARLLVGSASISV